MTVRGLDRAKILDKATQRGLVEAGHDMSDHEIDFLIFHPGLSTADKVTDVSGRGVGLDVVKRNIESLRGRIELTTRSGESTKFTLRLPLTMAIIDAMLIRCWEAAVLAAHHRHSAQLSSRTRRRFHGDRTRGKW